MVRWPGAWSLPLALLALGLVLVAAVAGRERSSSWWRDVAKASAGVVVGVVVAAGVGFALAQLVSVGHDSAMPRLTRTLLPFVAFVAAALGVVTAIAHRLRATSPAARLAGVWLVWGALAVTTAAAFPPACHLMVAPTLIAGMAALVAHRRNRWLGATLVAAALPAVLWGRVALGMVSAMGVAAHAVVALAVALAASTLLPALAEIPEDAPKTHRGLGAMALMLAAVSAARSPFDEGHPQRMSIVYLQRGAQASWWVDRTWGPWPPTMRLALPEAEEAAPILPVVGLQRAMKSPAPLDHQGSAVRASWLPGSARRLRLESSRGADWTGVIVPGSASYVAVEGRRASPWMLRHGTFAGHRVVLCASSQPRGCVFTLGGLEAGQSIEVFDAVRGMPSSAAALLDARAASFGVPSQHGDLRIDMDTLEVPPAAPP